MLYPVPGEFWIIGQRVRRQKIGSLQTHGLYRIAKLRSARLLSLSLRLPGREVDRDLPAHRSAQSARALPRLRTTDCPPAREGMQPVRRVLNLDLSTGGVGCSRAHVLTCCVGTTTISGGGGGGGPGIPGLQPAAVLVVRESHSVVLRHLQRGAALPRRLPSQGQGCHPAPVPQQAPGGAACVSQGPRGPAAGRSEAPPHERLLFFAVCGGDARGERLRLRLRFRVVSCSARYLRAPAACLLVYLAQFSRGPVLFRPVGSGGVRGAREGPRVGLLVGGGPLLGLDLPVGDREFDRDFGEGEDDVFTVLGFELLRAIGGRKNGPRTFLAIVEDVGLCVHPLEVEQEIGDCGAHVCVADLAERWPLLLDGDEVVSVGDEVGVLGSSPSSGASSAMGGGRGGGGGALFLPF
eukprot:scaffold5390_cov116-Isochrysis_galbana.AAC.7